MKPITIDMLFFTAGAVVVGFIAGAYMYAMKPVEKVCPTVEGQKVVSTTHDGNGHYCTYSRVTGMVKTRRKL